ncbi:MAG: hypothetical protein NTV70_10430 [Acidobacteria bacterium]|nr:hypothetical protein [Acidobacteriota bacterium]
MSFARWGKRVIGAAIPIGLNAAFIINLCDLVYRCGCRSWWAGAEAMCNIHQHGVRHCPFCSHGIALPAGVFAGVAAVQLWLSFRPWPPVVRFGAAVAAFPLVGGASLLVLGLFDGYWR